MKLSSTNPERPGDLRKGRLVQTHRCVHGLADLVIFKQLLGIPTVSELATESMFLNITTGFVRSCGGAQVRHIVQFVIKFLFLCDIRTMKNPAEPIGCFRENKPVVWFLLCPYSKTWAVLQ